MTWVGLCRGDGKQAAVRSSLLKRRAAAAAASDAARSRKVTLMRRYRLGELPDIQRVSVAAFLSPLGELPPLLLMYGPASVHVHDREKRYEH